jgi:predicted nuclease with TOPRIM domain
MLGSAILAGALVYFIYKNRCLEYNEKLTSLNQALTELQSERSDLIIKNDNMFVDNAIQTREIEELKIEINNLNQSIRRLEYDNHLLNDAYRTLEHYVQ